MLEALRTASRRRVVLADATKFGAPGRRVLWPWTDIDDLITDAALSPAFKRATHSAGTRVSVASM
jgi:DeoR/GlpR family transcriptional regulator of sugar metabolism